MNAVVLLVIALAVFALGYRFYAKFLALAVFRPGAAIGTDTAPAAPHALLLGGHHLAAICGGTTVLGAILAVSWGWVPAFLWVVTGTVVGAGTYALGSLWLAHRAPGRGLAAQTTDSLGAGARAPFHLLVLTVLILLGGVLAWLIGQLLQAYPAAVLPFWGQIAIALAAAYTLRRGLSIWLVAAGALSLLLLTVALGGVFPAIASGALYLRLGGVTLLTFDGATLWFIATLVYAYYSARLPAATLMRPRASLSAALLGIALVLVFAGILVAHPTLVAPQFNRAGFGAVPLLFVTLTGGALAGFHALIATRLTAPHLRGAMQTRVIGYGGALGDGLLALSAVLIGTAAFSGSEDWQAQFQTGLSDPTRAAMIYVSGFTRFTGDLGLPSTAMTTLAVVTLAGLALATLESVVRLLKDSLAELGETCRVERLRGEKPLALLAVLLAGAAALGDAQYAWPVLGAANQVLAGLVLLLVALGLMRLKAPLATVVVPMLFVAGVTAWALALAIADAAARADWALAAGGGFILLVQLWFVPIGIRAYRQTAAAAPA